MFAYCENNPVNNQDPTGEILITTLILIGAITVGVGAAVYTGVKAREAGCGWAETIVHSVMNGLMAYSAVYTFGTAAYGCYQDWCYLNGRTPITEIGAHNAPPVGTTTVVDRTTVYRSVSKAEAVDIQTSGQFNTVPNGMDAKQFGLSLDEVRSFGNWARQTNIVTAELPTSKISQFYTGGVDTRIFRSGTITVYGNQLAEFNNLVKGTIRLIE